MSAKSVLHMKHPKIIEVVTGKKLRLDRENTGHFKIKIIGKCMCIERQLHVRSIQKSLQLVHRNIFG